LWEAIFPRLDTVTAKTARLGASAKKPSIGLVSTVTSPDNSWGWAVFLLQLCAAADHDRRGGGCFSQKSLAIWNNRAARFPPGVSHLAGIYDTRRFGKSLSRAPHKARSPQDGRAARADLLELV